MSPPRLVLALASVLATPALFAGCGSGGQSVAAEQKLHAAPSFSPEQLNKPLSEKARTKGAQVAPPPTR